MIKGFVKTAIAAGLGIHLGIANAAGISDDIVKIGVLSDMAGVYADTAGAGSVTAAKMAIEDFGGTVLGKKIELVSMDHQNKADVGANTARRWFDVDKVDTIVDINNTAVHYAVKNIAEEKNKLSLNTAAASSDITGKHCSPMTIHWPYDTYALARTTAKAITDQGSKKWYMIGVDYAFGKAMVEDVNNTLKENNASIVGSIYHPLNSMDFSSYGPERPEIRC